MTKSRYSETLEYNSWKGLIQRCTNPNDCHYPEYGARGITVCDRWRASFKDFLADMGPRPTPRHSIDRIDGELGYKPSNCRWATSIEQNRNRRTNFNITLGSETKCFSAWCVYFGIDKGTVQSRIKCGWPIEVALKQPPRNQPKAKLYCYKGETKSLYEHAKTAVVGYNAIYQRLNKGWSLERAIETPPTPRSERNQLNQDKHS